MEHTKKMMLVDPEMMDRLQHQSVHPISRTLTSLDQDMERILRLPHLSDAEKWTRYKQALSRYLFFTEGARKPMGMPIINELGPMLEEDVESPSEKQPTDPHKAESLRLLKEHTLLAMPRAKRKVSELLYDTLARANNISWDETGSVSMNGQKIPGSSIIDLISDTVRNRKDTNPVGWQQFADILTDLNIPQEYIGNTRRWDFIRQKKVLPGTSTTTVQPIVKKSKRRAHSLPKYWETFKF
jgi:hypothetical protein